MTGIDVQTLIAQLQQLPPHLPVVFPLDENTEAAIVDVDAQGGEAVLGWVPR